jgi:HD-GYP domain-containing protein (c-di-GMP phosphodiesterase class II)
VAIGAAYDGLRVRRAYKPALAHAAALHLMLEGSTGQLDPTLLQVFRRCAGKFERNFLAVPD